MAPFWRARIKSRKIIPLTPFQQHLWRRSGDFCGIHFRKGARDKWDVDFTYLLDMIHDSFMSSPTSIVVNGGKMGFAMELILTPIIHRMIEEKRQRI